MTKAAKATKDITHAYVGYNKDDMAVLVYVDDRSKDCAKQCAKVMRQGGRIERVTLEQARVIGQSMYQRPEAKAP